MDKWGDMSWSKNVVFSIINPEEGKVIVPFPNLGSRNVLTFNAQRTSVSLMYELL